MRRIIATIVMVTMQYVATYAAEAIDNPLDFADRMLESLVISNPDAADQVLEDLSILNETVLDWCEQHGGELILPHIAALDCLVVAEACGRGASESIIRIRVSRRIFRGTLDRSISMADSFALRNCSSLFSSTSCVTRNSMANFQLSLCSIASGWKPESLQSVGSILNVHPDNRCAGRTSVIN